MSYFSPQLYTTQMKIIFLKIVPVSLNIFSTTLILTLALLMDLTSSTLWAQLK